MLTRDKVMDVFGEVCIDKTLVASAGIGKESSRSINLRRRMDS